MRCGGRGLDVGVVGGGGDARALGRQPHGHILLRGGRPGVVVLAIEHECGDVVTDEVVGLVCCRQQVGGHGGHSGGVVGEHSLAEESDDRGGYSVRDRLWLKDSVPDLRDLALEVLLGGTVEEVEHRAELFGARAGEGGRAGAHQGQRDRSAAADYRRTGD